MGREAASLIVSYPHYCWNLSNYNTRVVGGGSQSRQFSTNDSSFSSATGTNLVTLTNPVAVYSNLQDPKAVNQLRSELKGKALIYAIQHNNSTGFYMSGVLLSQRLDSITIY
jgi:diphthamide synthase subunit DPH2